MVNLKISIFLLLVTHCFLPDAFCQQIKTIDEMSSFRVMFYNVENLFDVEDDPLTADEEFTPEGERYWNNRKFYQKINNTYKVVMAVGQWNPPAIIGLCEIENRFVLNKLVYETPLKKFDYHIVHEESPDRRGIDVALIYRPEFFNPIHHEAIPIAFPFDSTYPTRDVLYIKGLVSNNDTLHLFVNHWPSRYGGYMATQSKREFVAALVRQKVDSLFQFQPGAAILIMGDFNDDPQDASLSEDLLAKNPVDNPQQSELYNLMLAKDPDWPNGSLKYQGNWNRFDQIIVSGGMLSDTSRLFVNKDGGKIFHDDFLLEQDETHLGDKPNRTYVGFKYNGGFSDHLPVFVDVFVNSEIIDR